MRVLNDAAINTEQNIQRIYYSKTTRIRYFGVIFTALAAYANIPFYAYSLPPLSHRFHSLTHAKSASWVFFFLASHLILFCRQAY